MTDTHRGHVTPRWSALLAARSRIHHARTCVSDIHCAVVLLISEEGKLLLCHAMKWLGKLLDITRLLCHYALVKGMILVSAIS